MERESWKVSEIWVYPIKGCKGTMLKEARIGVHGIEMDRQFVIVDAETGMFVAQRSSGDLGIGINSMCMINPVIEHDPLRFKISAPGMETMTVYPDMFVPIGTMRQKIRVWNWTGDALMADADTSYWFTEFLSRERPGQYRLMRFHGETRRAKVGYSQLRFADAYPFLVISQESLDDLNEYRIIGGKALPMNRFRPNIVISGGKPYDEDRLDRMVINGVDFEGMELCIRCPVTTTDQDTGERGHEPLKTLATYRRNPDRDKGGVVFGRNFNHLSTGTIRVGDEVTAISYNPIDPLDRFPVRLKSKS